GFASFLLRFPNEKVTVVVLSNSDRTSAAKVAANLSALVFGSPVRTPVLQPYDAIATVLAARGVPAAVARLRELRQAEPQNEAFGEDLLNEIGYDLLHADRAGDAVAVFAANVEDFPRSENAHDSLGEAYVALGDRAKAIASYERALALKPGLPSAVRALRQLRAPAQPK
ncbi:MAG: tetratricopeptide repeat protein, partial [Gemmatimonadaceae bacterium]|nr:tetratricopeptide repeat protein [Gemmatimonadaceae bacterium]